MAWAGRSRSRSGPGSSSPYCSASTASPLCCGGSGWTGSGLIFPIVQIIPLEITRDGGSSPLWTNRLLWLGVGHSRWFWKAWRRSTSRLIPTFPYMPIKPEYSLQLETRASRRRPGTPSATRRWRFTPLVIGLTYLLSLDVSFSCWFFYLFTKLQNGGRDLVRLPRPRRGADSGEHALYRRAGSSERLSAWLCISLEPGSSAACRSLAQGVPGGGGFR